MERTMIFKEVDEIVSRYKSQITGTVGILQDIQNRYNYLPREALVHIARRLNVPLSQVYSLATFYKAFSLRPRGKHLISLCMGTACHVRGAPRILERLQMILNIKPGQTSRDLQFSLETVNCLGACALGPLMVIDGEYFGKMSARKIEVILKRYKKSSGSQKNQENEENKDGV
jgi:NADH-quinone oxidoreductase subunit E